MPEDETEEQQLFRHSFVAEIRNFLDYAPDLADALNMLVSILAKTSEASRCFVYCQASPDGRWQFCEFGMDNLEPSRASGWLPSKSIIVAKIVVAPSPLVFSLRESGSMSENCRQELELLQGHSLLGAGFGPDSKNQGCLVLLQRNGPRTWSEEEIQFMQDLACELGRAIGQRYFR